MQQIKWINNRYQVIRPKVLVIDEIGYQGDRM